MSSSTTSVKVAPAARLKLAISAAKSAAGWSRCRKPLDSWPTMAFCDGRPLAKRPENNPNAVRMPSMSVPAVATFVVSVSCGRFAMAVAGVVMKLGAYGCLRVAMPLVAAATVFEKPPDPQSRPAYQAG